MRISQLFGKRQREVPSEADTISHQLLLKAGMISQLTAGVYSYLPLAWRTLSKIEAIVRDEMNKAGAQEVRLPVIHPVEIWQKSGREKAFGDNLFRLTDRKERRLVLGPTHEEVMAQLVSQHVQSYRDLPMRLYQIQTKFRDEPRPRGGLIRVREFDMKDLYSFDANEAGLDASYDKMVHAYENIYRRCGLPVILIQADSGAIGGKDSQEFMALTDIGEDEIILCQGCGYAANVEKAVSVKGVPEHSSEQPLSEVATPGKESIEEVALFLGISPRQTLKAVFYVAEGEFVLVVIRGDLEVNEIKLKKALGSTELRLASADEVISQGIISGSASAVGRPDLKVVADDSVLLGANFVAGANRAGYHLQGVNYRRDFTAKMVADIAKATAGQGCAGCGGPLRTARGMEVGHVFKLGTAISRAVGATFVDPEGQSRPIIMGSYGIGIGRLMAAIIELNHDDKGIIWPTSIAPYEVYLCALYPDNDAVACRADELYAELTTLGMEVLYDDRVESPGVKFNDADLLGIPIRVTLSPRSLEKGGIEIKKRTEAKAELISLAEAVAYISGLLDPATI
ncbi:MAG: proline--tRNA ligase [Dehalococcoidia bacterium]|nr:proline--tRNA ligase [Dehalococcoidia bacterium]